MKTSFTSFDSSAILTALCAILLTDAAASTPGTGWHTLRLRCLGDRIVALLSDKPAADVRDSIHQRGLVGLASRFHPARFDNLQIISPSNQP